MSIFFNCKLLAIVGLGQVPDHGHGITPPSDEDGEQAVEAVGHVGGHALVQARSMIVITNCTITDNAEGGRLGGSLVHRMMGDEMYLVASSNPIINLRLCDQSNGSPVQLVLEIGVVEVKIVTSTETILHTGSSPDCLGKIVLHLQYVVIEGIPGRQLLGLRVQMEATLENLDSLLLITT